MTIGNIFMCIVTILYIMSVITFIRKHGNPLDTCTDNRTHMRMISLWSSLLVVIALIYIVVFVLYLISLVFDNWNTVILNL